MNLHVDVDMALICVAIHCLQGFMQDFAGVGKSLHCNTNPARGSGAYPQGKF